MNQVTLILNGKRSNHNTLESAFVYARRQIVFERACGLLEHEVFEMLKEFFFLK